MATIRGVDLASYQGAPDFDRMKRAGIAFAITKVTEGTGYVFPGHRRNRDEANRVGMVSGAYHFAKGGNPVAEADHFVHNCGEMHRGEILVLDYELSMANPVSWCLAWLNRVHATTGVRPLIYLNKYTKSRFAWSVVVGGNYGLWLADYDNNPAAVPDPKPWPVCAIKQYSDRGRVDGVNGNVDLDVFYGTADAMRKYGRQ